ncbi:MAG TPA: SdrD B-like domain-containing protein [Pirellulales bacterium]|nr:SdrD B-like domain-containing protein [Pirellulales bacterium]
MWGPFPRSLFISSLRSSGHGKKSRPHSKRRNRRARQAEQLENRWLLTSDPIVTVDTNFGNFQIELRPDAAPQTVANFLQYVESGAYTDSIFHRSVPGFVEQAGGFTSTSTTFTSTSQFTEIPTNAPVALEYDLPNIAGSVAMARTSDANSATDQWFVNLADNTSTLAPGGSDPNGYAVFGQVIGNGMQVLDAIAALTVDNADGGTFSQLPLGPNNELVQISSVTIDSIDGTVFSDTNGNGTVDTGEQGIAGRTVFIDEAGTGIYQTGDPTATTDSSGDYSFSGLAAGTYKVVEELPNNVSLTNPSQTVTVVANETASGVNFAEEASIKGTIFTDTNDNGTLDTGEAGVSGQTVFLNNDGTGAPDSNNPSTVTDANGNYSFSDLVSGNYTVDVVPPSGTTISTPSANLSVTVSTGAAAQVVNIGEVPPSIAGTVFIDANDNAQFDSGDTGIAGRTVFINTDGSGTADGTNPQTTTNSLGQFTFSGLAAGSYTVEEVLPTGGTLTTPTQTITVTVGQTASGVLFGELPSITGTVFVDLSGSGTDTSADPGLAGQTVFLNIDGTGVPDSSNPSTTTDSNGNFAFGTEPAGNYTVEEVLPSNVSLSTAAQSITVTAGKTTTGVVFGDLPSISGTVFTDTNGNGTLDSGETGVSGRTVFINQDGSGTADGTNPQATTDTNGNYYFLGLAAGSYSVTEVIPTGVTLTTSVPETAVVTAGHVTAGIDLGESSSTGTGTGAISGTVFNDLNLNGQFDTGEPGLQGRKVFLNIDGTGVPDSNNPSTTTDANGDFSFTGLVAGNYSVEEVLSPVGSVSLTTQPVTLALTTGQNVSGVMIGNAVASTIVPIDLVDVKLPAASDADTAYIDALYQDILGHAPDPTGLAYWQQQMSSGVSNSTVAQTLWDSPEHRGEEVEQFYETFLGRASDPVGKAYWVAAYNSWGTEQIEVAGFIGSQEFQSLHSGDTSLVDALYSDVAERAADSAGESYWVNQLSSGTPQLQVLFSFIYGTEASTALVDSFYSEYLHRAPDSASLTTWVNDLTSQSLTADQVAIDILSGTEYFNDVTGDTAPTITSAAATSFTTGAAGSFTVTTSGMPAGALSESGALPSGVTFTDNGNGTATLAGTPASGSAGTYALTLSVNNGVGNAGTQSFVLTVTTTTTAPTFTSAASATFAVGTAGSFSISTTGSPTSALTETGSLPSGVTFVDNGNGTATLSGTPASGTANTYALTFSANNGGTPVTQSFTLTVGQAPSITTIADSTFNVGTSGTLNVQTSGFPTATITAAGLPSGVTLTDNHDGTAKISGTPAVGSGNTYNVTVTATNGIGTAATESFTLTVDEAPGITAIPATTFAVGTHGTLNVQTTGFPTDTISASGLPTGVTLTDNLNGTATIQGTPAAGSGGAYNVTVTASNSSGTAATRTFVLTVDEAPGITVIPATTFTVGTAGTINVQTTGYPFDTLSATGLPTGVTLTDNHDGTATIQGTPAAGSGGTYNVTVTGSNSSGTAATQSFVLTVDEAPSISAIANTTFTVGTAGSISVQTAGFPTDTITASGLPTGVTLTDNGDGTATISGTPAAGTGGTFNVTVSAANTSGTTATQSFTLTVDEAPSISTIADTTFTVGTAGSISVQTAGFPTDTITVSGLPNGVTYTDNGDGTATISGTPAAGTGGTHDVTVSAANSSGTTATQSFVLTVNEAPSISTIADTTFTVGTAGSISVQTAGFPTDTITVSGLPNGVTYTDNGDGTATIAGTPEVGSGGTYNVTVNAANSSGTTATQTFTLTVNEAPSISTIADTTFTVGTAGSIDVQTAGFPTDTITVSGLPNGVTYTDNGDGTATIAGTPEAGSGGTYNVTVNAANSSGPTATQTFVLTVDEAPSITSNNAAGFTAGTAGSFTVTTAGFPTAAISISASDTLPPGVALVDNGDGTATLSSTTSAAAGTYNFTIDATNGTSPDASQPFTLTIS